MVTPQTQPLMSICFGTADLFVYTQQNKRMQGFTLSNSKWTVAIFQQSEETCDVEMIVQIATCMKSSERQ